MPTKIEWTDEVWNPVTGCTKVSQGCKNCYAETIANRFWGSRKFTDVVCHEDRLEIPLRWRKPRKVFVNSMSDLFHPDVPDTFIARVFAVTALANHHTYQVLTKRPERMFQLLTRDSFVSDVKGWHKQIGQIHGMRSDDFGYPWPIPNVWLGVSVEDQATANERIPWLLKTPAAVRFVSYEPALGPVDWRWFTNAVVIGSILGGIDQIICGGESGPHARPMHPDWARLTRDQCKAAGIAFFFKQMMVDGKMVKLPELDGEQWIEYPKGG